MSKSFLIGAKGLLFNNGNILLLRDSRQFWDLPGGRIDADESPIQALSRELTEELPGIRDISIGPLVGWHRARNFSPKKDHSLMLLIFLVTAQVPEPVKLSHEHDHAEWMSIERAKSVSVQMANIDWDRVE
jgi:8-oxo-dGTP pyrophosphatase MutT (NUDIX family)